MKRLVNLNFGMPFFGVVRGLLLAEDELVLLLIDG